MPALAAVDGGDRQVVFVFGDLFWDALRRDCGYRCQANSIPRRQVFEAYCSGQAHHHACAFQSGEQVLNFGSANPSLPVEHGNFVVNAQKQFVTNGGEADSYVLSTRATREDADGLFNILILENGRPGAPVGHRLGMGLECAEIPRWGSPWENVRLPLGNLLGEEGDEIWFVLEIVAPLSSSP